MAGVLPHDAGTVSADLKVDLEKEDVGKAPKTFEPMVGAWVVAKDGYFKDYSVATK